MVVLLIPKLLWAVTAASPCNGGAWDSAFRDYRAAHPAATVQDFYKLAHQGILGSEHAIRDTAAVRAWMTREVAELPGRRVPQPETQREVEPLPPDGRFVRVHLRPYLARGGDPGALVAAFMATANAPRGDTAQFRCAEVALAGVGVEAAPYFADRRRAGFPAVHHSPAYEAAHGPAYRVVEQALVPR
jgi:hypothetical protein